MIGPLAAGDGEVDAETLGLWLGVNARTIRKLADRAVVVKTETRGRYHLKKSISNYCATLRKTALGRAGREGELDNLAESAALKRATRELVELKRDAIARKLISIEELTDAWSAIMRSVRGLALSIPSRLQEAMPHLQFEDFETARKVVHAALIEASEYVPDRPPLPTGLEADDQACRTGKRKRGRPPGHGTSLRR